MSASLLIATGMRTRCRPSEGVEIDRGGVIQASKLELRSCATKFTDLEWAAIKPMLPNKPRGVPLVDDRRVLNGIFWVLGSGARGVIWRRALALVRPATIATFAGEMVASGTGL